MSFDQRASTTVWRNELTGVLTLTLDERKAGFLAAALVIFVGFVAGQAWSIVTFVLHQVRAGTEDQDAYGQQVQAILRNGNSHAHAAWLTVRVALGWRRHIGFGAALRRGLPAMLIALTSVMVWSGAQLFTSKIWSTAGDQFLLQNVKCGYQGFAPSTIQQQTMWLKHWRNRLEAASIYERQCYTGLADLADCRTLPTRRLNWTMRDAACPFTDAGLCIRANNTPVSLDTGYIDSNSQLGINAPLADTVAYRKVITCSPMQTNRRCYFDGEGARFCDINDTNASQVREVGYYYGPLRAGSNETFKVTLTNSTWGGYRVTSRSYTPRIPQWQPDPEVTQRSDIQASIFFRTDDFMYYYHRADDPWFYTTRTPDVMQFKNESIPLYRSREMWLPSILGCIEEQELCNPLHAKCASYTQGTNFTDLYSHLQLSPNQRASASRIFDATLSFSLGFLVDKLPGDVLLASKSVWEGTQHEELPVTQWRAEVGRWFSISLILLQMGLLEGVTGPSDPSMRKLWIRYNTTSMIADCQRQRFRNVVDARNFNLASLIVVQVLGLAVIALGLTIDTAVGLIQAMSRRGTRLRYHWLRDGLFQQQRLAYTAAGVQPWLDTDTYVPVSHAHIPPLDCSDPLQQESGYSHNDNLVRVKPDGKGHYGYNDVDPLCLINGSEDLNYLEKYDEHI